jgi:hypothetical protein
VTWLPIVFGVTALINLIVTPFLPLGALPILPHDDSSLTYLVHVEQMSVDRRFGFYLELDDATDGGRLIVPPDSFVDPELAEGFADFEVTELDYDPGAPLPGVAIDPEPLGVVETTDGDRDYSIIDGDDDVWWLADLNGRVVVVPESVAPVPQVAP